MPVATYRWCGQRLVLCAPDHRWLRRIADITGLETSDAPAGATVDIDIRDDLNVRVYADEVAFATAADLLIWLTITISDVLMRLSGSFLLHAATLVRDGGAVLVFGAPHSGKSTLVWNAIEAGHDVLGDDLARYDHRARAIAGLPRPPKKRLAGDEELSVMTRDEALSAGSDLCGHLSGEPSRLAPRSRHGIVNDWNRSYPVEAIFLLRRHDGAGVTTEALDPDERLEMLLMHARDWGAGPIDAIGDLMPRDAVIVHVGHGEQRRALDAILSR